MFVCGDFLGETSDTALIVVVGWLGWVSGKS